MLPVWLTRIHFLSDIFAHVAVLGSLKFPTIDEKGEKTPFLKFRGLSFTEPDPCIPSPCENGATCSSDGNSYDCTCRIGWMGKNCQGKYLFNICVIKVKPITSCGFQSSYWWANTTIRCICICNNSLKSVSTCKYLPFYYSCPTNQPRP